MYRGIVLLMWLAALLACAPAPVTPTAPPTPQSTAPLVIYADAAAADVLRDIGVAFQQMYPAAQIEWTFAAPDALRAKLEAGARPDLIISADAALNQASQTRGGAAPKMIARDPLTLAVANANPAGLERAQDLNRVKLRVALARPETPLGKATRALLENFRHDADFGPDFPAQFYDSVTVQTDDARALLNALIAARADAGFVFSSDANIERARVQVFPIDPALNVAATYAVVALPSERDATPSLNFIKALTLPQAQTLWRDYGFEPIEK